MRFTGSECVGEHYMQCNMCAVVVVVWWWCVCVCFFLGGGWCSLVKFQLVSRKQLVAAFEGAQVP